MTESQREQSPIEGPPEGVADEVEDVEGHMPRWRLVADDGDGADLGDDVEGHAARVTGAEQHEPSVDVEGHVAR